MSALRQSAYVHRSRPRRVSRRVRAFRRREYEVVHFDTRRYRIPFRVIFTVVLIFAGGLGTAFTFAYLQNMRQQIDRQHVAIQLQRDENTAARAAMAQHLTVEEISRIAQEELNMGLPDASQIVRINVPRQSYVVQSSEAVYLPPQGAWESAVWYIRAWLGV